MSRRFSSSFIDARSHSFTCRPRFPRQCPPPRQRRTRPKLTHVAKSNRRTGARTLAQKAQVGQMPRNRPSAARRFHFLAGARLEIWRSCVRRSGGCGKTLARAAHSQRRAAVKRSKTCSSGGRETTAAAAKARLRLPSENTGIMTWPHARARSKGANSDWWPVAKRCCQFASIGQR